MPESGYFGAPADNATRAKVSSSGLLLWKMGKTAGCMELEKDPGPQYPEAGTPQPSESTPVTGQGGRTNQPVMTYVQVMNLDRVLAHMEMLGGRIAVPRTEIPGMGFTAIVTDSGGNAVGLWQMEV